MQNKKHDFSNTYTLTSEMEILMKTYTKDPTAALSRWTYILRFVFSIALIMPVVVLSQTLAPVNLGTAGNFVILAKTGVSSTGTTNITGDIGISPAAASFITGFGLIADPSNVFSKSSLVTGKLYASNYATPTPINMTTAIGDMQTAYTDAAGRKSPNFSELYTGDLTGRTLTHGLYKWSTNVLVSSGGVTISGTSKDVWIFQIAGTLIVGNGAIVSLSGGALASNVFWQVAGQVSLGTTAAMQGIILGQTGISMNTGASLNGRALAQTAVTLDANIVTTSAITGVKNSLTPQKFMLLQNYPNPFNPETVISYQIPVSGKVILKVFDILGNEVVELVN